MVCSARWFKCPVSIASYIMSQYNNCIHWDNFNFIWNVNFEYNVRHHMHFIIQIRQSETNCRFGTCAPLISVLNRIYILMQYCISCSSILRTSWYNQKKKKTQYIFIDKWKIKKYLAHFMYRHLSIVPNVMRWR